MTLAVITSAWIILLVSAAICIARATRGRIRLVDLPAPAPGTTASSAAGGPAQIQASIPERGAASTGTGAGEPFPQVRTVPQHTADRTTYDVACSACGILASRTLAEAAEEEARWHRTRGWHHAMYSTRAPGTTPPASQLRVDDPQEAS